MKIAGVDISHPDKKIFPKAGITKKEMLDYYERIADRMLPHLKDRPLTLHRYPDGINEDGFYQKKAQDYFPDYVDRVEIDTEDGKITQVIANTKQTLIYLANQGTLGFHIWLSREAKLRKPDRIVYDLDVDVEEDSAFAKAKKVAAILHDELKDKDPQLMTTGKGGMHVYYEIRRTKTFEDTHEETKKLADSLTEKHPDLITTETLKKNRKGRVFLDYLRNSYAQTAVCPYSLRPTENAGVATLLEWNELDKIESGNHYHLKNIFRRLGAKD